MTTHASATPLRVVLERELTPGRGFLPIDVGALAAEAPRVLAAWRERRPFGAAPEPLVRDAFSLPAGAPAVEVNLGRILAGEAVSVTSGQQPGYCGGAYLCLLKIATTIALARRLSARGTPAVPVFWNAADDTDFDEVAQAHLAAPSLALLKRALDPALRTPGLVVGAIPLESARPRLLEFFAGAGVDVAAFGEGLAHADALWESSHAASRDMGSLTGQFLARLFAEDGLVVVDARAEALRVGARALFERYAAIHAGLRETLASRAAEILAAGGERVLDDGALAWCLFRREGETRLRMEDRDRDEEVRRLLALDPPALSPNVVLRPVVEDHLFPHVARVVGPAEMLYHDELAPAYALLGVTRARPVARLAMTHLPREAEWLCGAGGGGAGDGGAGALWDDFDGVVRRAAARGSAAPRAGEALAALRADWSRGLEVVRTELAGGGGALVNELDRSAGKVDYELKRLEEALDDQNRRALYKREPRLRELRNYLFPRGLAQERKLSLSSIVAMWGTETPRLLVELAEHHLDALGDGRWVHHGVAHGEG